MTKAQEIRDLIAEQSSSTGERKAIEAAADRLEQTLAQDVPYRPEFKAQLRRRLMNEARRNLTPWYRRPAVWGSTMGVAAAAAILAVGLQFMQIAPTPGPNDGSTPPSPPGTTVPGDVGHGGAQVIPRVVSDLNLPAPALGDELLSSALPGPEPMNGVDWRAGLSVYLVSMQPNADQFDRIAQGLGFTQRPQVTNLGYHVAEGTRTLQLTSLGEVTYTDTASAGGAPADEAGALAAARRFLERAVLPIPSQPEVRQGEQQELVVSYMPRINGRPIVNERTVIRVAAGNQVARAIAYVQARRDTVKSYEALSPEQAVTRAQEQGGRFEQADLVYVRTASGEGVYLQPYWRVFGTNQSGARVARYVPALVR